MTSFNTIIRMLTKFSNILSKIFTSRGIFFDIEQMLH